MLDALLELAHESRVLEQAEAQRRGAAINATENRAVLHMALRGADMPDAPWGAEVSQAVRQELERFLEAAERIRDGRWRGHRGQRIANVINIGIGGSDLGPRMAVQALDAYASHEVRVHFVSNPDAWALHSLLRWCKPDSTLFIVQSKTFTTQETLTLAASVQRWLADHGLQTAEQQAPHLIAVTASPAVSAAQGYAPENTFGFWDWVGGRYSVWSAIGLPLAIAIGAEQFRAFLAGGHAMDRHFWEAAPEQNMPLLLALLGVWNGVPHAGAGAAQLRGLAGAGRGQDRVHQVRRRARQGQEPDPDRAQHAGRGRGAQPRHGPCAENGGGPAVRPSAVPDSSGRRRRRARLSGA